MKNLLTYSIISFLLFISTMTLYSYQQTTTKAATTTHQTAKINHTAELQPTEYKTTPTEQTAPNDQQTTSKYKTFTYTINKVSYNQSPVNDEYYGTSPDGTQIYFNSDYVMTTGQIKVGDTVTAYFDPKNTEDGLLFVKRN